MSLTNVSVQPCLNIFRDVNCVTSCGSCSVLGHYHPFQVCPYFEPKSVVLHRANLMFFYVNILF